MVGPMDHALVQDNRHRDQFFAGTTLLAMWAHPDDEAYLGAGLMAAVAARGGRVVTVTATLGEHGTDDPRACPPERLAPIRRAELTASLSFLGGEPPIVLGYPDGGCSDVPDQLGARRVASVIEDVRPHAVLTFGPDGVTGHPDHRAVGRWAAQAAASLGRPPALITTAAGSVWPDDIVRRMGRISAFLPGYPDDRPCRGDVNLALSGDALSTKLRALKCHRSQIGALVDLLGDDDYARLATAEAYRPANPAALTWLAEARDAFDRRPAAGERAA